MVANARSTALSAYPLIVEPDPPPTGLREDRRWHGYRAKIVAVNGLEQRTLVRDRRDDVAGARAQWVVLRYALTKVKRKELGREFGQHYTGGIALMIEGRQWTAYTAPIHRSLRRLEIPTGDGRWSHSSGDGPLRPVQIGRAMAGLLDRAADALDGRPMDPAARDRLVADMRLLALIRDFHPWRSAWPR